MNRPMSFILLIALLVVAFLSGCAGENNGGTAPIPPQTNLPPTLSPSMTATLLPTITSTADYYTPEERSANGKTWYAKDFVLDVYGNEGKGMCVVPQVNLDKYNTMVFNLPDPGDGLVFAQKSEFVRTSPNVWSIELHEEMFGIFASTTLEIAENKITETTTMISTMNETTTCVNIWTPME